MVTFSGTDLFNEIGDKNHFSNAPQMHMQELKKLLHFNHTHWNFAHIELCISNEGQQRLEQVMLVPCICAKLLQWCLTLCNPMDCSPPGSSVHGILQARILL